MEINGAYEGTIIQANQGLYGVTLFQVSHIANVHNTLTHTLKTPVDDAVCLSNERYISYTMMVFNDYKCEHNSST